MGSRALFGGNRHVELGIDSIVSFLPMQSTITFFRSLGNVALIEMGYRGLSANRLGACELRQDKVSQVRIGR